MQRFRRFACWLLAILATYLLIAPTTLFARTWTDSSGKFRIEAELVSFTDGKVTLRKTDGKTISLLLKN